MGLRAPRSTSTIMATVLAALVPGIAAMTAVWGFGVVWNVLWLSVFCVAIDAIALYLRGNQNWPALRFQLRDYSTLVTAWLMAIALPPQLPLGILLVASLAAIGLAKHAYGGLGRNVFNPAMVGYAVVLISYPAHLAVWPLLQPELTDALSGATLLSEFRFRDGLTADEFTLNYATAFKAQQMIPWAFAAGGAVLLYLKLIAWRIPAGIFAGLALCALFGNDSGSSQSLGSMGLHLTSGGLVAAAFFVATDPVTHPHRHAHQLMFGLGIGMLVYLMRGFGTQPDGIAFAILLANCVTPLLNRRAVKSQDAAPAAEQQNG